MQIWQQSPCFVIVYFENFCRDRQPTVISATCLCKTTKRGVKGQHTLFFYEQLSTLTRGGFPLHAKQTRIGVYNRPFEIAACTLFVFSMLTFSDECLIGIENYMHWKQQPQSHTNLKPNILNIRVNYVHNISLNTLY